ncbi:MAG: cell wall-active antibiotics response protein [Mediterranea sp.]|jgi:hypothetical protein|nr:cell wall-active antibiotics response protein [Mediterranea sp.]
MNEFIQKRRGYRKLDTLATALVFILVGLLFLGRNLGWVNDELFHAIVSWQTLLIVIGVVQLIKRHFWGGLILIVVGGYFLLPVPYGLSTYWPVVLIVVGLFILSHLWRGKGWHDHRHCHHQFDAERKEETTTQDGFVRSDVAFGTSKHIVLDPVFRGAALNVSFGSILLDLRRTQLVEQTTYINADASFAGIEIYVPSDWDVKSEVHNTLSGVDDKRYPSPQTDHEHQLVIRGNLSFSGIEIKN